MTAARNILRFIPAPKILTPGVATALFLFMFMGVSTAGEVEIIKEANVSTFMDISLKDITRINCDGQIGSITYSLEKEMEVTREDHDAYVKILPKLSKENKLVYSNLPRELYIDCAGKVFSLILAPKDIPAKTVILKPSVVDYEKARKFETANPYEKTVLDLIRHAYKEMPPDGYTVREINEEYKRFEGMTLTLKKQYLGSRYEAQEYIISVDGPTELYEGMFAPYIERALAIAIVKPKLAANEKTRMFVVRSKK